MLFQKYGWKNLSMGMGESQLSGHGALSQPKPIMNWFESLALPRFSNRELVRQIGEQLLQVIESNAKPSAEQSKEECSGCANKDTFITELQSRIIAGRQAKLELIRRLNLKNSKPSVASLQCKCRKKIASIKKMCEQKISKHEVEIANLKKQVTEGLAREKTLKHRLDTAKAFKGPKQRQRMLHVCDDCGYTTNEAYTFKKHVSTFCKFAQKCKDYVCKICNGNFDYDNLRVHLNRYIKPDNRKRCQNAHKNKTTEEHAILKQELIANRSSFLKKDN